MNVSASIVTFNSEPDIRFVLDSLLDAGLPETAITVVDNASADGTAALVRARFPSVSLIALPKNVGFARGHNAAIARSDAAYHLIVNPDIILSGEQLDRMLQYMDEHPDVAILTPKVLNPDGTEQFLPKRAPRLKYLIGGRLENRGKAFYRLRSAYTMRGEAVAEPVEIDFCTGCFMLCRTDALKRCGGFDERFFLYFEDADLTRSIHRYGKTVYFPDAFVHHAWKREDARDARMMLIHIVSMVKYWRKWRGEASARRGGIEG